MSERSPLESKKFVAAMLWNLLWLILIGYGIQKSIDASVLTAMVYCSGLSQIFYLGGQSAVDAVVRAAIAANPLPSIPEIPTDAP
jgi:hypothetical protein